METNDVHILLHLIRPGVLISTYHVVKIDVKYSINCSAMIVSNTSVSNTSEKTTNILICLLRFIDISSILLKIEEVSIFYYIIRMFY